MADPFLARLRAALNAYAAGVAEPREYLSLLRWQIDAGHALDQRTTLPGHVTTSALVVSPDARQTLLIDHIVIGRWLQPGGHYEPAETFQASAAREAVEETGVAALVLHPWHKVMDIPFAMAGRYIFSHTVIGLRSTALALLVNGSIVAQMYFYQINRPIFFVPACPRPRNANDFVSITPKSPSPAY